MKISTCIDEQFSLGMEIIKEIERKGEKFSEVNENNLHYLNKFNQELVSIFTTFGLKRLSSGLDKTAYLIEDLGAVIKVEKGFSQTNRFFDEHKKIYETIKSKCPHRILQTHFYDSTALRKKFYIQPIVETFDDWSVNGAQVALDIEKEIALKIENLNMAYLDIHFGNIGKIDESYVLIDW